MRSLTKWIVEVVLIAIAMMIALLVGTYAGEKQGRKAALNTDPVSEELEMVCAGLWISEQNREAFKQGIIR